MSTPQAALRANAKIADIIIAGSTAAVSVLLLPVADETDLKFTANVTTGVPAVTFTPATDAGMVREFNDADDCIKWLNSAFYDIQSMTIAIDDFASINNPFVPPTDAVKFATAQKAKYIKLAAANDTKLVVLNAKVASEVALGWPTSQYPALVALHAETLKQRDTVVSYKTNYSNEITRFNAIINP
jgi:hypothetical protein